MLRGGRLDYNTHCRVPFCVYCEVHEVPAPSNISESRTTGDIALGPNKNLQCGYFFFSLNAGKKFNRRKWTEFPVTLGVLKTVEELGEKELKRNKFIPTQNNVSFRDYDRNTLNIEKIELPDPIVS